MMSNDWPYGCTGRRKCGPIPQEDWTAKADQASFDVIQDSWKVAMHVDLPITTVMAVSAMQWKHQDHSSSSCE